MHHRDIKFSYGLHFFFTKQLSPKIKIHHNSQVKYTDTFVTKVGLSTEL